METYVQEINIVFNCFMNNYYRQSFEVDKLQPLLLANTLLKRRPELFGFKAIVYFPNMIPFTMPRHMSALLAENPRNRLRGVRQYDRSGREITLGRWVDAWLDRSNMNWYFLLHLALVVSKAALEAAKECRRVNEAEIAEIKRRIREQEFLTGIRKSRWDT